MPEPPRIDGLAIAEDVVGEADARHELLVLVVDAVGRDAGIAGEHHAGGQGAELRCALVGGIVGGIECGLDGRSCWARERRTPSAGRS